MAIDAVKAGVQGGTEQRPHRFELLDAMRGFALCGILLINLPHMAWLIDSSTPLPETRPGTASGALWWVRMLLVEGTMRGLFSLLFGASMILFMAKAEQGRTTAGRAQSLMCRRLAWLFLFGVGNSTLLLWPGDILIIYGIAGLLVLPACRLGAKAVGIAAIATLVALSVWMAGSQLPKQEWLRDGPVLQAEHISEDQMNTTQQRHFDQWREWHENRLASSADIERERSIRLGGYVRNFEFMSEVSWEWFLDWRETLRWVVDAAAFMLVGMFLFRRGMLQGHASPRVYWCFVIFGYGVGVPLKALEAVADWSLYVKLAEPQFWQFWLPALTMQFARCLVTLGHVGAFVLVWKALPPLRPLQALGRMAFTGYLLQSFLAAIVFSGFGFALWGTLNLVEVWVMAAIIWTIEIAFALFWLSRFTMGPFEWIWRALTYWRNPGSLRLPAV